MLPEDLDSGGGDESNRTNTTIVVSVSLCAFFHLFYFSKLIVFYSVRDRPAIGFFFHCRGCTGRRCGGRLDLVRSGCIAVAATAVALASDHS